MNFKLRIKQYIKMCMQHALLPLSYRIYRHKPIHSGLIVFADAHHSKRPESMQQLYVELSGQAAQKSLTLIEMYLNYQKASPWAVMRHMMQFMKLYAQAEYVVICDNYLPVASCRKRKETFVIQLWHACGALKKFGYDTEDDIPKQYCGNVFKNMDLVTVSSQACVKPFASAMRLSESCVRPLGISRTDVFFQEPWIAECREEFYQLYPQAAGKKIVLWAPTFRGNPGNPQLPDLDLGDLQQQLGEEWLVLCRVHPHMHERYADTDCAVSTNRLFPVIDVLIADYSSLIYEYLLLDKPLVLYSPDLESYRAKRGFYHDYSEIPAYRGREKRDLHRIVREAYRAGTDELQRQQFLKTYMENCDGHATERILQYMNRDR